PTATKDGVRTHICKDCGATKTESIPAMGSAQKDNGSSAKTGGAATTGTSGTSSVAATAKAGTSGTSSVAATAKAGTPSTGDPMVPLPVLAAMGLSGLVLLVAGSRMYVGRRRDKGDVS
ncbi:MAG: hypothetical protein IJ087_04830, partial [Eggerthellaceae bacterium]|nr:hypothetical protein [Eggerthellaceae bacterium]